MTSRLRALAPVSAALASLVLTALLVRSSLQACERHLTGLNQPAMALTAAPPAPGLRRPALSRRVVLVVIDGLGHWASQDLPVLDALRARGVDLVAHSHVPSISRPNYVSLLTGVPPRASGVRTNQFFGAVQLDSLPARLRASGGRALYVTDSAPGIATLFPSGFDEVAYAPWSGGYLRAARQALARPAQLVVLLPGGVDDCGHSGRMGSATCRAVTAEVDRQLGELVASLDLSLDTLLVTADHGHVRSGGHGGDEASVLEVPLVMAGAGVRRGQPALPSVELIDVSPTIAALLGVPAPGHGLGRPLLSALALPAAHAAALAADAARRVAANRAVVDDEAGRSAAALRVQRWRGVAPLAALLAALAAALVGLRTLGAARLALPTLLVGALALPAVATVMFLASDCIGSLSCFSDLAEWRERGWIAAAVGAAVLWLAARLLRARRGRRAVPRSALERLALDNGVTAAALAATALWHGAQAWVMAPSGFVVLPSREVLFLLVATPAATLSFALALLAWRTLELVTLLARVAGPLPLHRPPTADALPPFDVYRAVGP